MHPLVELAHRAVEEYVRNGVSIEAPEELEESMAERAGVFVSLKKGGRLRGCIGTIEPATENIALEVIKNAVYSATEDRRFQPVREEELEELEYSVDVLTEPEVVEDIGELDPKKYGVIVSFGAKRGLLLPDLEGVDTVQEQLKIARLKAGIGAQEEDVVIQRFEVIRHR